MILGKGQQAYPYILLPAQFFEPALVKARWDLRNWHLEVISRHFYSVQVLKQLQINPNSVDFGLHGGDDRRLLSYGL